MRYQPRFTGRTVLITGAARGQGRSHAQLLAGEGASLVLLDIDERSDAHRYGTAEADDLTTTEKLVRDAGGEAVCFRGDVRKVEDLQAAVDLATSTFGGLDGVCANAGILRPGTVVGTDEQQWRDTLDINLTGVWNTMRAAAPALVERGGGSIVVTNSVAGLKASRGAASYVAAKHALVGLVRAAALELGPDRIRVNGVHPTSVETPMVMNETMTRALRPDLDDPTVDDTREVRSAMHVLPIPWVEPVDISHAVAWLLSEEARYVTGVALPVDAGASIK